MSQKYTALIFLIFAVGNVVSYRFGGGLYNRPTRIKRLDAQHWIRSLNLVQNIEGGYFTEVYRSDETYTNLPERYGGENRTFGTSIYYLLEGYDFSLFHVLKTDELWHFYHGSPLSIFLIDPETGNLEVANLGPREKDNFMYLVPKGHIFGARLKNPRRRDYALVGTTMGPGFEFSDFLVPSREDLLASFPQHHKIINELTRV